MRFRVVRQVLGRVSPLFVILGWSASTAALALYAMFQGYLLPIAGGGNVGSFVIGPLPLPVLIFYLGNLGICVLAAVVIADTPKTLICFFPAYAGAWIITYLVLALPDILGCCLGVVELSAVSFTFGAFFPFLFVTELAGIFVGMGISGMLN